MLRNFFLLMLSLILLPSQVYADPIFPERGTAVVVDNGHVLTPETIKALSVKLTNWEHKTHHQLIVVTVPDLQGYPISDFAYQLGRKWRLGRTGIDDGIILLRAVKEKKTRIDVGTGLEVAMTDADAKSLLHETIVPTIRTKGIDAGLIVGADAIMDQINQRENEIKAEPIATPSVKIGGWLPLWIGFLLVVGVVTTILFFRLRRPKPKEKIKPTIYHGGWNSPYGDMTGRPTVGFPDYSGTSTHGPWPPPFTPTIPSISETVGYSSSSDDESSDIFRNRSSSSNDDGNDDSVFDSGFSSDNDDSSSFSGGGADESDDGS